MEFGNYTEEAITKNLINLTKEGKLLKNKRKRNKDSQSTGGVKKSRARKTTKEDKEESLEYNFQKILKESQNSISEVNKEKENNLKDQNEKENSINKSIEPTLSLTNSGANAFNDEAFENIIKEFLNINDFPTESKEKINLLKKFISIYKKIKDDKNKVTNF